MWLHDFESRLLAWRELRLNASKLPDDQGLLIINDWWFQAPWKPYYLHWDDIDNWPDPWDLLADNCYCDLARALGIVYTIKLIDKYSNYQIDLVETNETNLVLIDHGKYILNWGPHEMLNISSSPIHPLRHCVSSEKFNHLLR